MAKNNNKGFSLVEIIIAVAIFAILVVPITSQLISAININETSTKKQYAIDKAEEVMESFKTVSFAENVGETVTVSGDADENYVFDLKDVSVEDKDISGVGDVTYTLQTYTCDGISLGEAYEKYTCEVQVSSLAYSVSALGYIWLADSDSDDITAGDVKREGDSSSGAPVLSTSSAVGTVRNLDNTQVAVIAGTTYKSGATNNNLDMEAYENLLTEKVSLLQTYYPLEYNQYLSGEPVFDEGMFEKHTTISIDYDSTSDIYTVKCSVSYVDSSGFRLDNYYVDGTTNVYNAGTVYTHEYSELPPLYLLYTPGTYNGKYIDSDYIYIETSNLKDDDEVVLYIFETDTEVSDVYENIITSTLGVDSMDSLVFTNETYVGTYEDVNTYVLYADTESMNKGATAFTNFSVTTDTTVTPSTLNVTCYDTSADVSEEIYYYDIVVTLTDSDGNETVIKGTRGN